ncbi:MAG: hypothetical protein H6834_08985 [Planctomycetes bacterium]|nr:hypothetical protein [Planctomycetota bacterium]
MTPSRASFPGKRFVLTLALTSLVQAQEPYRFFLNDEEIHPASLSLEGTPETLRHGDFVWVDGFLLELGEPGTLHLRRFLSRLVDTSPDQRPLAVESGTLVRLQPRERLAVRTVRVTSWSDELQKRLEERGAQLGCLHLTDKALRDLARHETWSIPETVRAVHVTFEDVEPVPWTPLSRLPSLRLLLIVNRHRELVPTFYPPVLAASRDLRILKLHRITPDPFEAMSQCTSLRQLELTWGIGALPGSRIRSLDCLAALTHLRSVRLHATSVRDLAPLAHLPNLVEVSLPQGAVANLPTDGFETLQSLGLEGNPVEPGDLAAFRQAHPQCLTVHRVLDTVKAHWKDPTAFREALVTTVRDPRHCVDLLLETLGRDDVPHPIDTLMENLLRSFPEAIVAERVERFQSPGCDPTLGVPPGAAPRGRAPHTTHAPSRRGGVPPTRTHAGAEAGRHHVVAPLSFILRR